VKALTGIVQPTRGILVPVDAVSPQAEPAVTPLRLDIIEIFSATTAVFRVSVIRASGCSTMLSDAAQFC